MVRVRFPGGPPEIDTQPDRSAQAARTTWLRGVFVLSGASYRVRMSGKGRDRGRNHTGAANRPYLVPDGSWKLPADTKQGGCSPAGSPQNIERRNHDTHKLWQLPVVGRLGVQHGLLVGWFLLVAALAVMLVPGPASSANAPTSLAHPRRWTSVAKMTVASSSASAPARWSGSGDTVRSVESGWSSQVNTRGLGGTSGCSSRTRRWLADLECSHLEMEGAQQREYPRSSGTPT